MADSKPSATQDPLDADLSGRQLAGYRLLRRLGQGAMAEVYLAEQVSLGRQVAFKVLRSNLATDATYVQRFDQEARAAAQLVHANIVQIYEVGCVDGIHFIAQEYVQGSNLAELLARRGPPELRRALGIARQVAAALDKAAQHGIVHRDIKPENIMLAASGEVKVADFGLARVANQDNAPTNLTQIGVTMGTPLYMSPEQVEGRPLDSRSDIYSLGVTLYQMLAGQPPFRGETALSVAVMHLKTQPARLETVRADLPDSVCRVVHTMLAKQPGDRHASARDLLRELRSVALALFPDDPGEEIDSWGEDLANTVAARRQATQRLAAAMQTTALPAQRRSRDIWRFALAAAGCLLLGAALAFALRERPLVAPVDDDEAVPRRDTAAAQYIEAVMLNSEAAWKSVPQYFPDDQIFAHRARQGLALLYLQELDFEHALELFSDFAQMSSVEEQYKTFGLAGQAVVLNRLGRYRESAAKLAQLWPLRNKLEGEMRSLVAPTFRSNRKALGESNASQEWDEWFEKSAPPPTDDDPETPP